MIDPAPLPALPGAGEKGNEQRDVPLLAVEGLRTHFFTKAGVVKAVDDVSFSLARGEVLGLVGESGSGKSITGYSIMGLVDPPGRVLAGSMRLSGRELVGLPPEEMRKLRGNRIAMIFQDPMMTLNPVLRIDTQMVEAVRAHQDVDNAKAFQLAKAALQRVGIASPEERLRSYPHQFSGGMRQRVAIAIAMLNKPDLIICDEPTTALDVTIQCQILYRMQKICREHNTALIWITHDLGVVAELADRVAVMYAGRIVESGPVEQVLESPRHPYTRGLLDSMPGATQPGARLHQINGMAPSLAGRPSGCAFRPRCTKVIPRCTEQAPSVTTEGPRSYRCYVPIAREAQQA